MAKAWDEKCWDEKCHLRYLGNRLNSLLGKFPVLAFKFPFGHFSRFDFLNSLLPKFPVLAFNPYIKFINFLLESWDFHI